MAQAFPSHQQWLPFAAGVLGNARFVVELWITCGSKVGTCGLLGGHEAAAPSGVQAWNGGPA